MKTRTLLFISALGLATQVFGQLTAVDVQQVINQAVSRAVAISPNSVIAVTDREGYVLGVWVVRGGAATPGEIATAVSKAGTAAYLSSNQNAFSSRTAGFIIQQHFPPGVNNTPTGPLVGVGLSSLFVSDVTHFKRIDLVPCPPAIPPSVQSPGTLGSSIPFTSLDGSPGGVPLYKNHILVGGIGVTGDGTPQPSVPFVPTSPLVSLPACISVPLVPIARDENPFIYIDGYDKDEDVALAGEKGYAPLPSITADNVFINGIRLAYIASSGSGGSSDAIKSSKKSKKAKNKNKKNKKNKQVAPLILAGNADPGFPIVGPPPPYPYPITTFAGVTGEIRQQIMSDPLPGTIDGQPRLNATEVASIINYAVQRAKITRAGIRLPIGIPMEVFISVVNNPDADNVPPTVLGTFRTSDATVFSWDVAVQKARTAVFYSRHDFLGFGLNIAISARCVGFLAERFYPPGIDGNDHGPFYTEQDKLSGFSGTEPDVIFTATADTTPPGAVPLRNGIRADLPDGITIFPGGFPLYRNGVLIGAIGISGDGVDQDDIVGASGTHDFLAPDAIRSDEFFYRGTRLPYAKFPRDPGR